MTQTCQNTTAVRCFYETAACNAYNTASGADGQLPDVDDLEVAAAAAAGVLEPAWVVQRVLGNPITMPAPPPAAPVPPPTPQPLLSTPIACSVQLQVVGDTLSVRLIPTHDAASPTPAHPPAPMVSDDESSDESSSSSDSDDGMTEAQYVSSKAEVMEMMAAAAEDHDGAGSRVNVASELVRRGCVDDHIVRSCQQGMPPLERLDINIPDDSPLHPAGTLTSVVEGCLVVQGASGAAPLDVGSALCTADRLLLGVIEDIFGPVNAPLYVLRFSGGTEPPASLTPGVEVFAVSSMMQLVERPEVLGASQWVGSDEEGEEDESDDEDAEEEVLKVPVAKPALAKRPRRGGRGRGGRGQPQPPAFAGGAAFNAESLLAGYQQQFHWQAPPQPVPPQPPQPHAAWQGGAAWAPAPPNSLPPSYYRHQ